MESRLYDAPTLQRDVRPAVKAGRWIGIPLIIAIIIGPLCG